MSTIEVATPDTLSQMLGGSYTSNTQDNSPVTAEQYRSFSNMVDQASALRMKLVSNKNLLGKLNEDQFKRFEAVCNAALAARGEFFNKFQSFNGTRDIDCECGYPPGIDVYGPWPYIELYRRDPIANRVIQLYSKEMWTVQPKVRDAKVLKNPDVKSDFDEAVTDFQRLLHPEPSWYAGSTSGESSYAYEYLERVDTLSRIGTFGILLMGVNDGRSLEQPVAGSVIYNSKTGRNYVRNITFDDTHGYGDSYLSTIDEKRIIDTPVINAWDWNAKDLNGRYQPRPKYVPRLLSTYEDRQLAIWRAERQLVGEVNQLFPGVTNAALAHGAKQLIINVLDAKARWGTPLTKDEADVYNKLTGFRQSVNPNNPTNLYYNPATGQYVPGGRSSSDEQGGNAASERGRGGRQSDWPSQDPNYLNPSDLTGPGYSAYGKRPEGFTPAGMGRNPQNFGNGPLGSITGYGPNGSAPPNNEGYSYKNSATPGSQGSSPFQVRPGGDSPPRWGKQGQTTFPPTGSEGWGNGAGAPPPYGQGAYQYGRSDGWGAYGQSGESGWASVGLPYGALPNNPDGSGYAPSFANGDIPYQGFGAPPLNPGVPQPFGGQQYSSGYAVTPEGFAMTPGGPQAILPASILSGTDQQYYGVQFGPTELPAPGITPPHRLLFLRAYDEGLVQIVRYEWNIRNPRFGYPVMYRITLNDPTTQHAGVGLPLATVFVHWSRVLHVADVHANATASEIFAIPVCQPILNRLIDLQKLYGGSAEMYWKGAFPGLAFETRPELTGDVDVDVAGTQAMMQQYENGLRRYLTLVGMQVKSIAPQVVDPTNHIDKYLEAICIQIRWPKRKFIGAEQGQLASGQDEMDARRAVEERERNYGTPRLLVPFYDRLIKLNMFPAPEEGYIVEWPERYAASDKDKSIVSVGWIKAIQQYYASGLAMFMAPKTFFVTIMKFTEDQADAIIEAGKKYKKENEPQSELPGAPINSPYGMPPTPAPSPLGAAGTGALGAGAAGGNGGQGSPLGGAFANPDEFFGHHGEEQRQSEHGDYVGVKNAHTVPDGERVHNVHSDLTLGAYEKHLKDLYGEDISLVDNPFVSEAQRAWMHINHPEMAKEWEEHTPKGKKLPKHVKGSKAKGGDGATANVRHDFSVNGGCSIDLPDVVQPNDYWCWPSGAKSVGMHWGVGPDKLKEWAKALETTKAESTCPTAVAKYFQQLGCQVLARKNMTIAMVKHLLKKGWPILVPIQEYMSGSSSPKAKKAYGHCIALCGYLDNYLIAQDPSEDNVIRPKKSGSINAGGKVLICEETFLKAWHDREWVRTGIAVGPKE